jgi:hypothetical protein
MTREEGLDYLISQYSGSGPSRPSRFLVLDDLDDVPCPPELIAEYDSEYTVRMAFDDFVEDDSFAVRNFL